MISLAKIAHQSCKYKLPISKSLSMLSACTKSQSVWNDAREKMPTDAFRVLFADEFRIHIGTVWYCNDTAYWSTGIQLWEISKYPLWSYLPELPYK